MNLWKISEGTNIDIVDNTGLITISADQYSVSTNTATAELTLSKTHSGSTSNVSTSSLLPNLAGAGKVLSINTSNNGIEWATVTSGSGGISNALAGCSRSNNDLIFTQAVGNNFTVGLPLQQSFAVSGGTYTANTGAIAITQTNGTPSNIQGPIINTVLNSSPGANDVYSCGYHDAVRGVDISLIDTKLTEPSGNNSRASAAHFLTSNGTNNIWCHDLIHNSNNTLTIKHVNGLEFGLATAGCVPHEYRCNATLMLVLFLERDIMQKQIMEIPIHIPKTIL